LQWISCILHESHAPRRRRKGAGLYNLRFRSQQIGLPMFIRVFEDKKSLGRAAADQAAIAIQRAIRERGSARIIAATAASQLEFLNALTESAGIDWKKSRRSISMNTSDFRSRIREAFEKC